MEEKWESQSFAPYRRHTQGPIEETASVPIRCARINKDEDTQIAISSLENNMATTSMACEKQGDQLVRTSARHVQRNGNHRLRAGRPGMSEQSLML